MRPTSAQCSTQQRAPGMNRRGSALILTLMMTMTMAALALSAIYLSSNASLLSRHYGREQDFRYAAEAALAMGKSRLNTDADALPDTGYAALMQNAPIVGADGVRVPGITVNIYAGKTGSTSGQFGSFASVIAEARDAQGSRFVRRLELNQESFAKFAYWSDRESNNGSTIYFGNGDNLWGPVWSNDVINIASTGATFHDVVGTAKTINGVSYGTYDKGYSINQRPIELPDNEKLESLPGLAGLGGLSFNAPTNGSETAVNMRIEFVAVDLNADGDATDADEGFLRIYTGGPGNERWTRGDYPQPASTANALNCGDWHDINGVPRFFPAAIHNTDWFRAAMRTGNGGPMATAAQANTESTLALSAIMRHANARCFPGGDPHLVAVERNSATFTAAQKQIGGSPTTFTPTGRYGAWRPWSGTVDPRLASRPDAAYLFPLHRTLNPGSKGVVYVNGTVAVSGTLRGKVTLYSNANVVIIDDLRYATDPSTGRCLDMLGIIADHDIVVADNAILTPPEVTNNSWVNLDDTKDLYIHGVLMALQTSFRVENYTSAPASANGCEGSTSGRGCLYLTGGIIQERRGAVGQLSGTGFVKRYSYDRCAAVSPPPYFPTTGRFEDNRYYEIDPVRFDVAAMFARLTPS